MKKYKKIVLAGGTGQIGKALCKYYTNNTEELIILSRTTEQKQGNITCIKWDGKTLGAWAKAIDGADMLINLAGKNVNCRYTEKNKKEIFDSRTNSIEVLAQAVALCKEAPKLWIQSASATIYRHAEDRPMSEEDGETGNGFSVEVCKKWEKSFSEQTAQFKNMRKAILRTSLVLGKEDGVFPRLKNLTKFGLGGKQGNGQQWISWIHEEDVVGIIEWIATHPEIEGIINCTSPYPIKNKELMDVIRKSYGIKIGLPSPKWLLEFGAVIIGTETELILKSRWVLPEKISRSGFQFQYPKINSAIDQLVNS
jgi:uncharacterized protein (TIGR01777 family)